MSRVDKAITAFFACVFAIVAVCLASVVPAAWALVLGTPFIIASGVLIGVVLMVPTTKERGDR